MAAKIFISYRREDSAAYAGRIQDRLEREFGRELLFIDVDGIPLGINFPKVLREEVTKCAALLAVIGPHWLDARDESGTRRLDNPTDFVRIEIATALHREIPVVPILLDGTRVPKANQLPKDLRELALRNGLDVRHTTFHTDMDKLIRELEGQVGASLVSQPPPQNRRQGDANGAELGPRRRSRADKVSPSGTVSPKPPVPDDVEGQVRSIVLSGRVPPATWCPFILSLNLGLTDVSDVSPLASLTALKNLALYETQVTDLSPLTGLTALEVLDLRATKVTDLSPLADLTALETLHLASTLVSDLSPLAGLTELSNLTLDETQVRDLSPLAGLITLRNLLLNETQVTDLSPLTGLAVLGGLGLNSTQVTDLSPLAGLKALVTLGLRSTQVRNLSPLAGLTRLRSLDLNSTQVTDLSPLADLTALEDLEFRGKTFKAASLVSLLRRVKQKS